MGYGHKRGGRLLQWPYSEAEKTAAAAVCLSNNVVAARWKEGSIRTEHMHHNLFINFYRRIFLRIRLLFRNHALSYPLNLPRSTARPRSPVLFASSGTERLSV